MQMMPAFIPRYTATINGREVRYRELPFVPPPTALRAPFVIRRPAADERTFEQLAHALGLDEESASAVLCALNFRVCPDLIEIPPSALLVVPEAAAIDGFLSGDTSAL